MRSNKNIETSLNELPLQIQRAQDEFKKHNIYAELREQESKFMSDQFLRNELAKIAANITSLNNEINELTASQVAAQQAIFDYEKKSSVAKFFSGKSAVEQAQSALHYISTRLPQANGELQRQFVLEQEFSRQLESLLVLQEQIKAVFPSKTQEYWEKELMQLQSKLAANKDALPKHISRKITLIEEQHNLEQQQAQVKQSFDVVREYERLLWQEQEYLKKVKDAINQENLRCSEYLERELLLCDTFFYAPTSEGNASLFNELSKLFDTVKSEVACVEIDVIRSEKEDAENQIFKILQQLNVLNQKMLELEKQAIMSAKIVGATLAKSYLSETLRERKFDTVILDEASMASIPALWCVSYLAENSIVIVGDFLQLPPIVMAETPMARKWLGKDIFHHSGMQERAKDKDTCPDNFVMLNDQFRMESDIADIANMYYGEYGDYAPTMTLSSG